MDTSISKILIRWRASHISFKYIECEFLSVMQKVVQGHSNGAVNIWLLVDVLAWDPVQWWSNKILFVMLITHGIVESIVNWLWSKHAIINVVVQAPSIIMQRMCYTCNDLRFCIDQGYLWFHRFMNHLITTFHTHISSDKSLCNFSDLIISRRMWTQFWNASKDPWKFNQNSIPMLWWLCSISIRTLFLSPQIS